MRPRRRLKRPCYFTSIKNLAYLWIQPDVSQYFWAQHVLYVGLSCFNVLRHVGYRWLSLKMVKFFMQFLWMLRYVGQGFATILRARVCAVVRLPTPNMSQKVSTGRSGETHATCCDMVRSFGWDLQILGQHCCVGMLRSLSRGFRWVTFSSRIKYITLFA